MPREEARRSPRESDEGAASRPQGQNAPCAGDFAAASGTDCFRACADSAGLAPDGVYVYAERGEGRTNRPPCTGSTVAPTVTAHWKANQHKATAHHRIFHTKRRGDRLEMNWGKGGATDWVRTSNLRLRRPTLYPIELQSQIGVYYTIHPYRQSMPGDRKV